MILAAPALVPPPAVRPVVLDRDAVMRDLRHVLANEDAFAALMDGRTGLVSSHAVVVSAAAAEGMRQAVAMLDRVVALPSVRHTMLSLTQWPDATTAAPATGALCFDFHLTARGPRLIEINTNPGGLLLAAALAQAVGQAVDVRAAALSFAGSGRHVAIVDDRPQQQFLWPEFLLYRDLFQAEGRRATIADAAGISLRGIDALYNRLTDFRLELPEHAALAQAWRAGDVGFTPDPLAHALVADKRLLALLSSRDALAAHGTTAADRDAVAALVPAAAILCAETEAELWDRRRHLFFKPVAGYGAKAVYRGDKISRATWDALPRGATIAQDFVPPTRLALAGGGALKCDFRAFALAGRMVLLTARLYQGQTTNFRTPGGGFAPVVVDDAG